MHSVISLQDITIFKYEELKDSKLFISPKIPHLHMIRSLSFQLFIWKRKENDFLITGYLSSKNQEIFPKLNTLTDSFKKEMVMGFNFFSPEMDYNS